MDVVENVDVHSLGVRVEHENGVFRNGKGVEKLARGIVSAFKTESDFMITSSSSFLDSFQFHFF